MSMVPPPARDNHHDPLADILDRYLADLEAGSAPSREELLARHPDLAPDLQQCLATLEFIRRATPSPGSREARPEPPPAAPADALVNGILGDFRILRLVAHGGMGVVYEAEQISLGRRVALKVLPFAAMLDAAQLRRFKNEIHAAANLHHSHIVPVFACGHDRGVHYYAMQFIDGQTLASVVRELRHMRKAPAGPATPDPTGTPAPSAAGESGPSSSSLIFHSSTTPGAVLSTERTGRDAHYFRTVARLGVQAAEALQYAHEQGVIHRDIKPANLLLDAHGKLWVTDFGLAQSLRKNGDLTLSGDLVGTLRYMSPEQALAKRVDVDHRTDLYSLGATLYELLTLEHAFDGRDREELLRQIAFEEPQPPRRVCKDIPVELETIVLKAMRKNPAERYAAAAELADDLRRYLEDQPIQARRPTPVQRLTKWSRRHRPVVVAASVFLGVVTLGSLASNVLILRAQRDAEAQRLRAEAKSEMARRAVDEMYTEVAEEWLEDRPHMEPVQRRFLENALRCYEEFGRENSTDPEVRYRTASACLRVGRIRQTFGQRTQADAALYQARRLLDELVQEVPAERRYRAALGEVYRQQSQLDVTGSAAAGEPSARKALALFEALCIEAQDAPEGAKYRAERIGAQYHLGLALVRGKKWPEAEQFLSDAIQRNKELLDPDNLDARFQHNLAGLHNNLAGVYKNTNRPREEELNYRQATELLEPLVTQFPTRSRHRELLAACLHNLGSVLGPKGRFTEAAGCLRRAADLRVQLAADFPSVPGHRAHAALALQLLAGVQARQQQYDAARETYGKALDLRKKAADAAPAQLEAIFPLVQLYLERAMLLRQRSSLTDARKDLDEGISRWRAALRLGPDETCQCPLLESLYQELARVFLAQGKHAEAARVVAERLTPTPANAIMFWSRAFLLLECAQVAQRDSLPQAERQSVARDYREHARELVKKVVTSAGDDPGQCNFVAWQLVVCREVELRDPARAVALARKAVDKDPHQAAYWNTLGAAHYRAGDWKAAQAALQTSCELADGGDGVDHFLLAMTCARLGDKAKAQGWFGRGEAWAKEHPEANPDVDRFRAEAKTLLAQ